MFIALYFSNHNDNRELDCEEHEKLKDEAYDKGRTDTKLDAIVSTVNRIDGNVENMRKNITNINFRLGEVERSAKKAHERIDEHLKGDK